MSSMLKKLLVLGGALTHVPFEMFPRILNTNDAVPTHPKTLKNDYYRSASESDRRYKAALAKRERKAEKLMKLERLKAPPKWPEFTYDGERWSYNESELASWDDELGWDFHSFHGLVNPTKESVIEYLKSYGV